jgi:hypothetical protein
LYLGKRALRGWIAPLLESAFGLDARQTSRELLFTWLGPVGDLEFARARGLPALLDGLARAQADLRLGAKVDAVLDAGRGLRLASGEQLSADACVLAVGPREVLRLVADLGHVEREILAGCRSAEQHWLELEVDQARPPAPLGWCSGVAALCDATPRGASGVRLLLRAPGAVEPAELVARAEQLVPDLTRRIRGQRGPMGTAAPAFDVGHFRRLARLFAEAEARPARRMALCGDWLIGPDAEAQAASGERAAQSALAHMRRSVR